MSSYGFAMTPDRKSGKADRCAHQTGSYAGVHSELSQMLALMQIKMDLNHLNILAHRATLWILKMSFLFF